MSFFKDAGITIVCILLGIVLSVQYRSVKVNDTVAVYEQQRVKDRKSVV